MKKIRVLDLFAGIGAFDSALDRLGIDYELVDAIELDKYAMASFNAVHGTNFECQDICEWDKDVGDIDIMWQSSPCQSLSNAGKGHGADKGSGTRSSLVWEVVRIAEKVKPKIIIWENVKGLVSKKHKHNHTEYMNELEKLGYNSYWKVLNTKDFLLPQNRERCYTISIRKDIDNGNFEFPEATLLVKRLKDVLEPKVDEKYYISNKQLAGMARTKFNSYKLDNLLRDKNGEAKTLTARFEGCPQMVDQPLYQEAIDTAIEKGMVEPTDVIEYTYSNARRKEVEQGFIRKQNQGDKDIMPTLKTNPQQLGVTVEEPFIAASRGRSQGDWHESEHYQQLEPREDGVTNTISSVAKDNYVVEPQPIKRRRTEYGKQVRKAYENHEIESNENMRENYVADDGVMPTLTASRREQQIAEPQVINPLKGKSGKGWHFEQQVYDQEGIARTVKAGGGSGNIPKVIEPNLKEKLCNELVEKGIVEGGEVINHSYTNSEQRKELSDYIENDTGVMPTLTTRPDIMGYVEPKPNLRIRKLTPKETWRLQGFHDDEFEKAEKVVSSAQAYKQAGNSVTVSVIAALLLQLGYGKKKWNDMSLEERTKIVEG